MIVYTGDWLQVPAQSLAKLFKYGKIEHPSLVLPKILQSVKAS